MLKRPTVLQWWSSMLLKKQWTGAPQLNTMRTTPPPSRPLGKTKGGISVQKLENFRTVFLTRAIKKARLVCLIFPLLAKSSIFQALESRRLSEVALAIQMCITNLAIKVVLREESKMVK